MFGLWCSELLVVCVGLLGSLICYVGCVLCVGCLLLNLLVSRWGLLVLFGSCWILVCVLV